MAKLSHSPNGWSRVKLSEIIRELLSGVSVNGEDRSAGPGEAGVLKVSSVSNGRFFPAENKVISGIEAERARMTVSRGDVLISRSNTFELVGASGIANDDFPNLFLPDKLWKVVLEYPSRDSLEWLLHVLNSSLMRQSLKAIATGTSGSMKNISKDSFLSIRVLRPTFPEQRKIATILSTWDRAIELTENLIAAKQKRKRALMQKLLTGKVRFKEFEASPWVRVSLGKLLKEVKRFVEWNDDDEYHLLSIRRRSGGMFDRETKRGHDIKTKVMMTTEAGDFVIARMQAVHGAIAVTPRELHGRHVSGSYSTFVARDAAKLHMPFLNYVSQMPDFYRSLLLSAYGVTIEKMTFNLPWFLSEKIDLPSMLEEQRRIADVFVAFDDENKILMHRLHQLRHQKNGLMQQLLTGSVRVGVEDKR